MERHIVFIGQLRHSHYLTQTHTHTHTRVHTQKQNHWQSATIWCVFFVMLISSAGIGCRHQVKNKSHTRIHTLYRTLLNLPSIPCFNLTSTSFLCAIIFSVLSLYFAFSPLFSSISNQSFWFLPTEADPTTGLLSIGKSKRGHDLWSSSRQERFFGDHTIILMPCKCSDFWDI